jgi:hypothetical protein
MHSDHIPLDPTASERFRVVGRWMALASILLAGVGSVVIAVGRLALAYFGLL